MIVDRGTSLGNKQFTVHGRSTSADHATELFNTDFTVTTKPGGPGVGTRIVQDSSTTNFTVDALNVGQRVLAFGTLTGTVMDATATTPIVRAEPTSLFAFANSAVAVGNLEVDLVVPAPLARVEEVGVVTTTTPFNWGADNFPIVRDANHFKVAVGSLGNGLGIAPATGLMNVSSRLEPAAARRAGDHVAKVLDTGRRSAALRDRNIAGITVDTVVTSTPVFTVTGTPGAARRGLRPRAARPVNLPDPPPSRSVRATAVVYCLQDVTAGTVKSFPTFGSS